MSNVKRTERGWAGHFIGAKECLFRRNTLLECGDVRIIISSVGDYHPVAGSSRTIGHQRTYETMAFHAQWETPYWDADVSREVPFESDWGVFGLEPKRDGDKEANEIHEAVVGELTTKLLDGAFDA